MHKISWILLFLLILLGISKIWSFEQGNSFSWTKCKESLLIYLIQGKCSLREIYKDNDNQIYH